MLETDAFIPDDYQRIPNNLSTGERKSFQEMRFLNDHSA